MKISNTEFITSAILTSILIIVLILLQINCGLQWERPAREGLAVIANGLKAADEINAEIQELTNDKIEEDILTKVKERHIERTECLKIKTDCPEELDASSMYDKARADIIENIRIIKLTRETLIEGEKIIDAAVKSKKISEDTWTNWCKRLEESVVKINKSLNTILINHQIKIDKPEELKLLINSTEEICTISGMLKGNHK